MRFIKKYTIFTMLFLFLMSINTVAFAASKYVDDGAGVLSSSMQDKISTNFEKVEKNSGAVVKMVTVKSLNKQDVKAVAQAYASKNLSGDKYVLFLVAPNDGKTQFLVGPGLNAVFSSGDIDKISHLPDSDFKSKKFDDGFSKVGQAIDQKVTATAVKTGDAKVSSNGYSNTVKPATPWGKYFLIFLVIVALIVIFVLWFKKKADKEQERRKQQFINDNYDSLHDLDTSSSSFKTGSVGTGSTTTKSTIYVAPETQYKPYNDPIYDNDSYVVHETHETVRTTPPVHTHSSGTNHTTIHNTTVVNNNNNRGSGFGSNGFVEGMLVNEMLHDHHDDHHHNHHDDYNNDYHDNHNNHSSYKDPEPTVTSGNWDNSGTSDWGSSSSSSSSSSSWGSSSSDDSSSSSSYDSGSSWDSSSSSDSGSSDW